MTIKPHPSHTGHFYRDPPSATDADGTRHWITRGANFVVVATHAVPGAVMDRPSSQQSDEYLLLLPAGTNAQVTSGSETVAMTGSPPVVVDIPIST